MIASIGSELRFSKHICCFIRKLWLAREKYKRHDFILSYYAVTILLMKSSHGQLLVDRAVNDAWTPLSEEYKGFLVQQASHLQYSVLSLNS